jgi:hypothetical protein
MILQLTALGFLVFAAPIRSQQTPSTFDWGKAAKEIRRVQPGAFPELPPAIRNELNRRRCTIPQADGYPNPHNVIKGSFTDKGRIDWAVLCSQGGESSILVFRGDSIEGVSQLANGPDKSWLQTVGEREIGYSRMISSVNEVSITRYHREFGGPTPPAIDHQGIEDSFVGKASVILYYYRGTWIELTGAD